MDSVWRKWQRQDGNDPKSKFNVPLNWQEIWNYSQNWGTPGQDSIEERWTQCITLLLKININNGLCYRERAPLPAQIMNSPAMPLMRENEIVNPNQRNANWNLGANQMVVSFILVSSYASVPWHGGMGHYHGAVPLNKQAGHTLVSSPPPLLTQSFSFFLFLCSSWTPWAPQHLS